MDGAMTTFESSIAANLAAAAEDAEEAAGRRLARGVVRALGERGFSSLTEFTLRNGRRADVLALDRSGNVTIVEVKSSLEDFRSDRKWPEYLEFCDLFYFAVPETFPKDLIPESCGLMVADAFSAAVLREAEPSGLAPARRKAITLRFALAAATRLERLTDPR